jgi:parvulin-like peptidyl-prolyl isomerase
MRRSDRFLIVALIILLAASVLRAAEPPAYAPDSASVVAYVNGTPIPAYFVERELVRIHSSGMAQDSVSRASFSVENLVQRLINNELLAEEARAIGLDQDSSVLETMADFRDNFAYGVMMGELFPDTFKASMDELQKEYKIMFQRVKLRTLCIVDSAVAMKVADSIRQGADMASFAKTWSVDRFKDQGGDAGFSYLASLPALMQNRVLKGPDNVVLEPMRLWRTWVLARIEGHAEADTLVAFDSVRAGLEQRIVGMKRKNAIDAYVDSLRRRFTVTTDTTMLDSILDRMGRAEPPKPIIVARVGTSRTLDEAGLRQAYLRRSMGSKDVDADVFIRERLRDEVQTMLMKEAASFPHFVNNPRVIEALRSVEDSILVINYLQEVIGARVSVSPAEIQTYYDQNQDRFRVSSRFKVSTITRVSPADADSDWQSLRSGTDFGWLARQHSVDDVAKRGGDRGWLMPSQIPTSARAVLDTAAIGTFTRPTPTEDGVVIYRLDAREAGNIIPLEKASKGIEGRLLQKKQYEAIGETVQKLRASANIVIQDSVIKSLQISGRIEPAPAGHMPMGQ